MRDALNKIHGFLLSPYLQSGVEERSDVTKILARHKRTKYFLDKITPGTDKRGLVTNAKCVAIWPSFFNANVISSVIK